jgi:DNA processing protein
LQLIRSGVRLIRSADDVIEDLKGLSATDHPTPAREFPALQDRFPRPGERLTVDPQELPTPAAGLPVIAPEPPLVLEPALRRVYDTLTTRRHADELTRELGLPIAELSRLLMQLELKKLVRRHAGNYYERR